MSSHYSKADVSDDVDALIRKFLTMHPKVLFTTSSIRKALEIYREEDIRAALNSECDRGFLEANILWRCDECDSAAVASPTGDATEAFCRSSECRTTRPFTRFLYFKGTNDFLRRLGDSKKLNPKKDEAVRIEAAAEKMPALASAPPEKSDIPTPEEVWATLKRIEDSTSATAGNTKSIATDAQNIAGSTASTAASTDSIARDPIPAESLRVGRRNLYVTVAGIILATVVAVLVAYLFAPEDVRHNAVKVVTSFLSSAPSSAGDRNHVVSPTATAKAHHPKP